MLGSAGAGPHCERIVVSVPVLLAMMSTLKAVPGNPKATGISTTVVISSCCVVSVKMPEDSTGRVTCEKA